MDKKRKKIGLKVSQYVDTLAHGAEKHTLVVMADIIAQRYNLDIIGCEIYPDELSKYNILTYFNYYKFPKTLRKILHIPMAILNTITYAKREKPDLLFALGGPYYNGLAVLIAGKMYGIKTLIRTAEDHFNYYKYCETFSCKIKHFFINYLVSKFVLLKADYVLVVGEESKKYFITKGINKNSIFGIPGPISQENFYVPKPKKDLRIELGLPLEKIIVLYIGAISGVKGTNELPIIMKNVLEKNNQYFFCIIGAETNSNTITEEIKRVGGNNCCVMPSMPHSKLKLYMNASDVLVFLTKIGVGYGQVTIEATKAQLPVIAYDSGLDVKWFLKENCYKSISEITNAILEKQYYLATLPSEFDVKYIYSKHLDMIEHIFKTDTI